MIGGFKKSAGRLAMVAAAGLLIGLAPATAADLDGDCCEDLEERVATLEATTVRKGNRKVSVKLSGWVNEAVMYWDDGVESDVYQVNNSQFVSRYRFTGSAKISHHLTAGYLQEFYILGSSSLGANQDNDDGNSPGDSVLLTGRHYWFLKHKHLGQLIVGRTGTATDELAEIDLGGGRATVGIDTFYVGGGLWLTQGNVNAAAGATRMRDIFTPFDIARGNAVRYNSPAIAGFKVSAAWGEDDVWDVALRFAGEVGGIRVAFGVGYYETTDNASGSGVGGQPTMDDEGDSRFLGSVSVWDAENTGLYFTGAWNAGDDGGITAGVKDNRDTLRWALRAGIRQNFLGIGKTNIFAGYQKAENENQDVRLCATTTSPTACTLTAAGAFLGDQEATQWEVGLVQDIDAAVMQLYIQYRHLDFDIRNDATGAKANVNDMQILHAGALIKF